MKQTNKQKECTVTLVIREVVIYLLAFTVKLKVTSAYIAPLDGSVLRRVERKKTLEKTRLSNRSRLEKTTRMILLCLKNKDEAKQVNLSVVLQHY